MPKCSELLQLIKSGPQGVKMAMENMFFDNEKQVSSYRNHARYRRVRQTIDWNDVHQESIVRFVDKVLDGVGNQEL